MPGLELRPFVVASSAPIESERIKTCRGLSGLLRATSRTHRPRARASKTVMGSARRHGVESVVRQLTPMSRPDTYGTSGISEARLSDSATRTISAASAFDHARVTRMSTAAAASAPFFCEHIFFDEGACEKS